MLYTARTVYLRLEGDAFANPSNIFAFDLFQFTSNGWSWYNHLRYLDYCIPPGRTTQRDWNTAPNVEGRLKGETRGSNLTMCCETRCVYCVQLTRDGQSSSLYEERHSSTAESYPEEKVSIDEHNDWSLFCSLQ